MRTSQTLASVLMILALVVTPGTSFAHEHEDESPDSSVLGSITVCKIIVDTEGDIRTNSPLPVVTMTVAGGTNGVLVLPDTTLTTPLTANAHLLATTTEDDAACTTYSDLALGEYYYGEESLSSDADYDEPLFNDQYDTPVHSTSDFYQYMAADNQNADGTITLTAARPDRTLVVLNTYTAGTPVVETPPTDVCPNVVGDQAEGPCADTLCVAPAAWNTDTQACVAPVVDTGGGSGPTDETPTPTVTAPVLGGGPIGGTGGFGGGIIGGGNGQVLGASCGVYMDKYVRIGRKNNVEQVKKLQEFLNKHEGASIPVTGFYGPLSENAVKKFQSKHMKDVLSPWNIDAPTGLVYQTTLLQINKVECPDLTQDVPALVPWSANPHID